MREERKEREAAASDVEVTACAKEFCFALRKKEERRKTLFLFFSSRTFLTGVDSSNLAAVTRALFLFDSSGKRGVMREWKGTV